MSGLCRNRWRPVPTCFGSGSEMSEQPVHPSTAQPIIIKFLTREGIKPVYILQRLTAQFGDKTLPRAYLFTWHKEFKEGRERLKLRNMVAILERALRRTTFARFVHLLKRIDGGQFQTL